jgi:hypothetical protein
MKVENEKQMISWLLCERIAQMCSHKCKKHIFFYLPLLRHEVVQNRYAEFSPGGVQTGLLNAVVRKRRQAPARILKHGEPRLKT